nr:MULTISPECIES: VirB3 family type IV secretion system protein [Xanthomonas]
MIVDEQTNPDGYEVPVHRALSTPRLLVGIPRDMAVVAFTTAAALVLGLQSWWSLPFYIVIHIGLVLLTKYDTQWPEALKRALRLKNHYRA